MATKVVIGKMKSEDEKCIITYMEDILDIEPRQVVKHLCDDGILSSEDERNIEKKKLRTARVEELVKVLVNRGPSSFDGFLRALSKNGHLDLASKLKNMAEGKKSGRSQTPQRMKSTDIGIRPRQQEPSIQQPKVVTQERKSDVPLPKPLVNETSDDESDCTEDSEINQISAEHDHQDMERSNEVYESLKTTYASVDKTMKNMNPIFDLLENDAEKTQIKEELKNQMKKVDEEKKRLDKPGLEQKVFNRDMVIYVMQMNKVLTLMTSYLMRIIDSLQERETKHMKRIKDMQKDIQILKKDLESKNAELAEIERDRCAERQGFVTDLSYVLQKGLEENRKQLQGDLQRELQRERRERDLENAWKEREKKRKEEERAERKQREKDKQKIEEQERELARLKEEKEQMTKESTASKNEASENPKPAKRKQSTSRNVFVPRTHKPSLPVKGKAVQGQTRKKKP